MKKKVISALLASLLAGSQASAQGQPQGQPSGQPQDAAPLQKVFDFFGGKKTPGTPPPLREDSNRLVEIFAELAWLADPLTFPFYLEARVVSGQLQVHGNVPSSKVRDQALKVARLHSPLLVVDAMKENPNLNVRYLRMPPTQLQNAVHTAIRESMPQQAKFLQTRSSADGRVVVSGRITSFEEKLAISQSLRRLHGCTSVTNTVQVASDPDGFVARSLTRPPTSQSTVPAALASAANPAQPAVTAQPANNKKPGPLSALLASKEKTPEAAPPVALVRVPPTPPPAAQIGVPQPAASVPVANVPATSAPATSVPTPSTVPAPTSPINPLGLKKRIEATCPSARDIRVTVLSLTDVRVEIRAARPEEGDQLAGQILSLPELESYRVDLQINLAQP